MAIRRTAQLEPNTAPIEAPQSEVLEQIKHPRIELREPSEVNGYLDPDQTLINFAVRELGMSFDQLIAEDPSRLLRNWLKCYRGAKTTAIATVALGAIAVIVGVGTGAAPLMFAGLATAAGSGFLVKRHQSGVEACEIEASILDEIRPILELFHALEARGANPSDLVSLYDRLLKQYTSAPHLTTLGNADDLKAFFEAELAKHTTLSKFLATPTGFASAVKPTSKPAPAIAPALLAAPQDNPFELAADPWDGTGPIFQWEGNPTAVPLKQRADEVIRYLDSVGFPIGVILNTPTTLGYGGSQSGKSTILHLSAILELAQGKKVFYTSPDDDVPPIKYTKILEGRGCETALEFIEKLTKMLDKASKGQWSNQTFWIDEWYKISKYDQTHSGNGKAVKLQALIDQILGKGAKSGAQVRGAAQVATLDALGLSGISEAIGRDFLVLNAIKQPATSFESERALGVYECDRGNNKEQWTTPAALKTVIRPDGLPDPILSMLCWFPEIQDETRLDKWLNPQSHVISPGQLFDETPVEEETVVESELMPQSTDIKVDSAIARSLNKVLLNYLQSQPSKKSLDDIYRLTSVRNILGKSDKVLTKCHLDSLVNIGVIESDSNDNYWVNSSNNN